MDLNGINITLKLLCSSHTVATHINSNRNFQSCLSWDSCLPNTHGCVCTVQEWLVVLSVLFVYRESVDVCYPSWWNWFPAVCPQRWPGWLLLVCSDVVCCLTASFPCCCLFSQCLCYESLVLTAESTIAVYGFIREVPEGKTVSCTALVTKTWIVSVVNFVAVCRLLVDMNWLLTIGSWLDLLLQVEPTMLSTGSVSACAFLLCPFLSVHVFLSPYNTVQPTIWIFPVSRLLQDSPVLTLKHSQFLWTFAFSKLLVFWSDSMLNYSYWYSTCLLLWAPLANWLYKVSR